MATTWEGLLRATGGAINADKSCWYLLDYDWSGTKWNYRPSITMPGTLELRHASGEIRKLERKEPWDVILWRDMKSWASNKVSLLIQLLEIYK